ncbi:MAG: hypothetical protein ING36_09440 [Burkholderiales bacterium]|nr:hypothetical protein [Burkholderiales bacterium]
MEGLEAIEILLSGLNEERRIDSQYFRKRYIAEDACRRHFRTITLGSQAFITDGPHGYHVVDESSAIAMLTAKCAKQWFADRSEADSIDVATHESSLRSSLEVDDLILSTRGTVGACALVEPEALPANIDQDVARIAIQNGGDISPRFALAYLNSKFGQDWIERNSTGMVQQGLSLAKVRELPIPLLSVQIQDQISNLVRMASSARKRSKELMSSAENNLLHALGLNTWTPPEALNYVRSSSDAFAAGRLDSQFFAPRVEQLLARLGRDGLTIADVAPARHERFEPTATGDFDYIEIGSLGADGTAVAEAVPMAEAPSRATQYVRSGDVITSTVRPIRRLSALINPDQDGAVCSSGFVVLEPRGVSSEVLLTYLRLPVVCELMDLHTSATMYPAISEADLLSLPIPAIAPPVQQQIQADVRQAAQARQRATQLLNAAKHAVEIAIEDSEAAALTYLKGLM